MRYESARWSQLPGWQADQAQEAWGAFLQSCNARNLPTALLNACAAASPIAVASPEQARTFFEANFTPYRIVRVESPRVSSDTGLITGYYEPLLRGSRNASTTFSTALYAPPDDMLTIELGDAFPELQGKRIRGRLQGKKVLPYFDRAALQNHPSLKGKELAIRHWFQGNPARTHEVLNSNPGVVFFREERIDDPSIGPKGSLGVALTAGRSVAVDATFIPLGAPLFLSTTLPVTDAPLQRLVMAQDTGGAIRGPVRADLFWGFGASAGESAGLMKQQGQLWLLWPTGALLPAGQ